MTHFNFFKLSTYKCVTDGDGTIRPLSFRFLTAMHVFCHVSDLSPENSSNGEPRVSFFFVICPMIQSRHQPLIR